MTDPKEKKKRPEIKTRAPGRISRPGMFDRVKLRPEIHPIEEIIAGAQATPSEIEPLINSEPVAVSEPLHKTEPPSESERGTPSVLPQPPLQTEPLSKSEPVTDSEGVLILSERAAHLRFPYEVLDGIMGKLKPAPRVVLQRLYRLSAGWDTDVCIVSIGKLASTCKIGETQVRQYLRDLEAEGLIERIEDDISNKNLEARGIKFRVLLPRMPPARNRTGSEKWRGSDSEPNKVNTQKENTQTQDSLAAGVRVGSKFSIEECRRYAEHLRSTGQGINNPGGYATTIHRTGEADELIESFLNPTASTWVDVSQCPDCKGSGFYYPNGPSGGVAKCKHEKLVREGN